MGIEIERKFLLRDDTWRTFVTQSILIQQGYLCRDKDRTVRIRTWGDQGKITIKSAPVHGRCQEFEYTIPLSEAQDMLASMCLDFPICKTRHLIQWGDLTWEVDEFDGELTGLVMAEIELNSIDQTFEVPTWIGREVTEDHRFKNANLSTCDASAWRLLQQGL